MKRNYGIDLLRLVLMYMVVLLHVLGKGGVQGTAELLSSQYATTYLLRALALCAVNGYGMITGYVSYGKKWRLAGLGQLWLQVLFYSLSISVCVWLRSPERFSFDQLIHYCFPVYGEVYWYFASYVGMFFLIPIMNRVLDELTEKQSRLIMGLAFLGISVLPTVFNMDPFSLGQGFTSGWLAYLYLIGGCIRKFEWGNEIGWKKGLIYYLASCLLTWLGKLGMDAVTLKLFGETRVFIDLQAYTSPTMVLAAVSLLLVFKKLNLNSWIGKITAVFSPAAFGVYLIHWQPHFRDYFLQDKFSKLADFSPVALTLSVLGITLCIFAFCIAVDSVRHRVFLWLDVRGKLEKLETRLKTKLEL